MLTLAALAADPERFHLIDVRDAEAYAVAHATGAMHIPLAELEGLAGELPTRKIPLRYLTCGRDRSCSRV
ncbi:rhodanese-like domain-containing protein [Roseovarius sp. D0-M9]|uniref:rhodanese-like domain-containing protein n=1 Tax=Roseovarius sp. D0-M9 TaxID=3127117 RepID=UPI00300FE7C5